MKAKHHSRLGLPAVTNHLYVSAFAFSKRSTVFRIRSGMTDVIVGVTGTARRAPTRRKANYGCRLRPRRPPTAAGKGVALEIEIEYCIGDESQILLWPLATCPGAYL